MDEQSFEPACRGGSLLVSESRVMRRGAIAWSLWRSQITGVGCACADAGDGATAYLHLRDGRRFAVEQMTPRECFQLLGCFAYEAEPDAQTGAGRNGAPLAIDLGDGQTRVVAGPRSVTLEQHHSTLWSVPREQLLGVHVIAGRATAAVEIMGRSGAAALLDEVPFGPALHLLVALGAAPAESAPLAPLTVDARGSASSTIAEPGAAPLSPRTPSPAAAPHAGKHPLPTAAPSQATQRRRAARTDAAEVKPPQPSERAGGRKRAKTTEVAKPPMSEGSGPRAMNTPPATPARTRRRTTRSAPTERVAHKTAGTGRHKAAHPTPPRANRRRRRRVATTQAPVQMRIPKPAPVAAMVRGPAVETVPGSLRPQRPPALPETRSASAFAFDCPSPDRVAARPASPLVPGDWGDDYPHPGRDRARALLAGAMRVGHASAQRATASMRAGLRLSRDMPEAWRKEIAAASPARLWHATRLLVAAVAVVLVLAGALAADATLAPRPHAAILGPAGVAPSHAAMSATGSASVIYVGSQDGAIYALDARSGTLLWRFETGSPVEGGPVVVGGVIYAGESDGSIVALQAASHHELWRYHTGGSVGAAPAVVNGVVYAGSSDHELYALRASDGTLLWRFAAGDWFASTPAVSGGMVYAGNYDGTLYALRASDGAEVWHLTTSSAVVVAATVTGGMVYAGSSNDTLYAIDARSGAIRWRYSTGGSIYAAPVLANGVVYAGSCDTYLYALRASDGRLLWRAATGGLVLVTPVVAGQLVYVSAADGTLEALSAGGMLRWRYAAHDAAAVVPAATSGAVYGSAGNASLFSLDALHGTLRWSYRTSGHLTSSLIGVSGS